MIEARLALNRGEYDALMMAWLVRKVLHDGHRSLLQVVARERGIDDADLPRFEIDDVEALRVEETLGHASTPELS